MVIATAGIPETLEYVVEKLAGAGLAASHTVGGLVVPGAWVHVHSYERHTLTGARLGVHVDLIAEGVSEVHAIAQLDDMLARALTVITPTAPIETDNAIEFDSGALPSFRIPITIEYTPEKTS